MEDGLALSSEPDPVGPDRTKARNPFALLAGSILIGLALALLLFGGGLFNLDGAQQESSRLVQLPDVGNSPSAALSTSNRLIEVGDRSLNFELKDLDGDTHELYALRGRPVVVNFWATWCTPCRVEMPELQAVYEQHIDEGLAILAVNFDEPAETVSRFFQDEMGLKFTPLLDIDGLVAERYGVYNFPSTFFISKEGIVQSIHRGPMVRQQIEDHLSRIIPSLQ
jgi:peroxiredoxin